MEREFRKFILQHQLNGDEGYVAERFIEMMKEDNWDVRIENGALIFESNFSLSDFNYISNIIEYKWEYFRDGFILGYTTAMGNIK